MLNNKNCNCGNPEWGFNCVCKHMKMFPGNIAYTCEFCGLYESSKPRCSRCEVCFS